MTGGYMHNWLSIDLSTGQVAREDFDGHVLRDYLGGYGLGARVLYDRMEAGVDPLGPQSFLGLLTGPLTGTPAITGNRFMAVGKSPLTNTWGDSNCGGRFGPQMKFAGCDGVFFSGISEEPVYALIRDGKAELRSAAALWGKNAQETESVLRSEFGREAEVACIGTAGERLSLVSCILNQFGRAAGRCGLGAVMGSKKLKAVVVCGGGEVPVHEAALVSRLRKDYLRQAGGAHPVLSALGSCVGVGPNLYCGDAPVRNWSGSVPRQFSEAAVAAIDAGSVVALEKRKYACWRCPIGCGGHMKRYEGQSVLVSHKPEYETLIALGSLCMNDDLESIITANDICNDYGLDTISMGGIIAFAIECYENGLITRADTGGLELHWGDGQAIAKLAEIIAKRQDIGEVLADGVQLAARRIGRGAERFAIHVGGQEPGMHDPKFAPGQAIAHQMDAAPGRHTPVTEGMPPQLDGSLLRAADKYDYASEILAANRRWLLSYYHAWSSLGLCMYGYISYPMNFIPEFTAAVTGWDVDADELAKTGERIANLRHVFNLREGLNPLDFRLPDRMVGRPPIQEGGVAGITVDTESMNRAWLEAMEWDPATTRPSDRKLAELGLEGVSRDLARMKQAEAPPG